MFCLREANARFKRGLYQLTELSDADEELFTQGACWEFSFVLQSMGLEAAVLMRMAYGEPSYEHAFAIDKYDYAVDITGRKTIDKMLANWQRSFKNDKLSVIRGREAIEIYKDTRPNKGLMAQAKEIIDEQPHVWVKK